MSTLTNNLAQALRLMDEAYCDVGPRMDRLKGRQALMRSREALAEYDATPAGEVTADAVEVADDVSGLMWELLGKATAYTEDRRFFVLTKAGVKACLSQVIGALIQRAANTQEALSMMHTQYKEASAERDTLSAENARLAKDAERYKFWRKYYGSRFALVLPGATLRFEGWRPEVELALHDYEPKVDAAIDAAMKQDAATAQAKQSPEKTP